MQISLLNCVKKQGSRKTRNGLKMMSLWKQFRKLISSFSFLLILSILIFTIIHTTENKSKKHLKSIRVQMVGDEAKFFIPERRLVHLDLKGGPPKISFFQDLFPLIRLAGGTDLLIEWEDMFPYTGVLANASSKVAYTVQEVKIILELAEKSNLSVIPLVQTFGHLEHLLKIKGKISS
ncbi:hexosaminidase D [Eurytemora carolleeae]|uniref:hexosaminidase D n=1 Tax=Eurytemora carolleeae TaxID=1294199 RepID=UPI000C7832A2|nr:hexosaminidase D [Eurytemora carolleeae]|eukprot:XP_023344087.1 hexosaminidase D-like [Eurytemora affinis]